MVPAVIFAIIMLVVFVLLFVTVFAKRNKSGAFCPHCESTALVEIGRQILDTNTIEQHGGGYGGGGDIRIQTQEEVTYRCNNCQKNSTVIVRKTN